MHSTINIHVYGISKLRFISWTYYTYECYIMAERVGRGTPCLLWSLGVREVVGSRPDRGNSKESFSSNQETGKVFSPEMPFYSKF